MMPSNTDYAGNSLGFGTESVCSFWLMMSCVLQIITHQNTDHTPADKPLNASPPACVFDYINIQKHSNQQHYPGPKETGGLFLLHLGARKCAVDDTTI